MKTTSHNEANRSSGNRHPAQVSRRGSAGYQRGASVIEMIFLMTFFSLLLIGVVDMGRALYYTIEVSDAARAGLMYGYQTSATAADSAGIVTAAKADAPSSASPGVDLGTIAMTTTSSHGCMCSDGSSITLNCTTRPSCSSPTHRVNYVIVTTSATYTPLFPWPGVPTSIPITSKAQSFGGQ